MTTTEPTIRTPHGEMGAVLHRPATEPIGGVLVLMEAFGVNAHIRDVCRRFADLGLVALAPDLFHRSGRFLTGDYADPSGVMEHFGRLRTDDMATDIVAASDWLRAEIDQAALGVIGFCLGGYGAVLAAIRTQPAVVAGFYGAGLAIRREGSPLEPLAGEFDSIECPVHLFYGADDPVIPSEEVGATERRLAEAGVEHTVTVYGAAGHGFFCDERGSYRASAATDAWDRVTSAFVPAGETG